jgi:hypothetical protein
MDPVIPSEVPPVNPSQTLHGACPACQSPIHVEGGVVKGGGPSEFLQELQRKAESADEWRAKAIALEAEHTSRDISDPAPRVIPAAPADPAGETEYFL